MIHHPEIRTIIQGEVAISADTSVVFATLLGSCISVCMYDPLSHVGGINHFLLPDGKESPSGTAMRFGVNSMEMLINGLLKAGGQRNRLACKVFGGAAVVPTLGRIGEENIRFVTHYLEYEGIRCVSQSLGGTLARRIRFWPTTGRAQQNLVQDGQGIGRQEVDYSRREAEAERKWAKGASSAVELF
ncbi:chemotaxis protein CheD [Gluconobacter japonicus]|uniref:Probable chemoreceptor glutamine deamidase CheD n=1 Tax=Gluconobacter japonicus TaxID=376620 RepID=A0ABQ5WI25_GLUJA|nr:chemotaxis protein CheD [Gluconobacter japonicus]GLQ59655.1 putative chemoreceptor glutamine deamidase CheD [Gluconobacter japonicus]